MRILSIESRRLASRRFEDNVALVDVSSRKLHSLNPAATLLWEAITKGSTVDALVDLLCDAYDVDAASARHDVEEFIEVLAEQGLVTIDDCVSETLPVAESPSQRRTG